MESYVWHLVVGLTLAAGGAVIVWTARAGASGRLRRNELVGIRTAATLASDEAWAAAHRAGARRTEIGGWCAIATGVSALLPLPVTALVVIALVGTCVLGGFTTAGAVADVRAAKAIAPPTRATMNP